MVKTLPSKHHFHKYPIYQRVFLFSWKGRCGLVLLFFLGWSSTLFAQNSETLSQKNSSTAIEEGVQLSASEEKFTAAMQQWQAGNFSEAEQQLLILAEAGHLKAQSILAAAYLRGENLFQDYDKALRWCNQCALEGENDCVYMLGSMYYHGMGLEKDWDKALEYFTYLAEQGDQQSQVNAGHILFLRAVPDYEAALRWLEPAAAQDNPDAQALLGYAYRFGFGVSENKKKANEWYRKAAGNGSQAAQKFLEKEGLTW